MKVKSFIRNIITICLIIVICICGYKIYSKLYEYKKADNIYNDLRKEKIIQIRIVAIKQIKIKKTA